MVSCWCVRAMPVYVIVDDVDAHFARAKAAGAVITREPVTQDYGGRDYTAKDPEGHVWTFGTYDPWAAPARTHAGGHATEPRRKRWRGDFVDAVVVQTTR